MTPAMPTLKTAVREFLTAIPERHQVTLLGFNDQVFSLARRATNPAERAEAVDRLGAWGQTALYDLIIRAVDLLGQQSGRRALVVFTDGEDQGSRATIEAAEQRLQESDVVLYMIGQGRGVTLDTLKKIMQRLSTPTGGRALFAERIDELKDAFGDILEELSNQYLLAYPPPDSRRDGSTRRLRVEVSGGHQIRARQGYRISSSAR